MEFTNVEDTSSQKMNVPLNGSVLQSASSVENDEPLNFDDELGDINPTVIKIIGCGGGGSSAVQRMIEDGVSGVQFIVLNTDKQALHKSTAQLRVPIGQKITGGLGAGGNPAVGENAAKEDAERISRIISGANMVIITAGMGGGTGTGSAPVVAELSHNAGILTIAVVTTPFEFEGKVRMDNAMEGLEKLRQNVDSLIVLPNDLIFKAVENVDHRMTFREQFKFADGLLCAGVKGITELITQPGDINLDFADVRKIMYGSGDSILGVGKGKGENRVNEAVEGAIANPLLENRQIDGARKILINITVLCWLQKISGMFKIRTLCLIFFLFPLLFRKQCHPACDHKFDDTAHMAYRRRLIFFMGTQMHKDIDLQMRDPVDHVVFDPRKPLFICDPIRKHAVMVF